MHDTEDAGSTASIYRYKVMEGKDYPGERRVRGVGGET